MTLSSAFFSEVKLESHGCMCFSRGDNTGEEIWYQPQTEQEIRKKTFKWFVQQYIHILIKEHHCTRFRTPFFFTCKTFLSLPPCRLKLTLNYSPSLSADARVKQAQIKHIRLFKKARLGPLSSQQCKPASQPANSIYIHGCEKSSRKPEPNICSIPICVTLHLPVPLPWSRRLSHSLFLVSAFFKMIWPLPLFFSKSFPLYDLVMLNWFLCGIKVDFCIKATSVWLLFSTMSKYWPAP